MTILTSSNSLSASCMRDRTSDQFSPPSPLPSAGIAMDRIPRDRISSASDPNPDSMSSIRLLPRQWRLVGKFTMNRGEIISPVSKMNTFPGWNLVALATGSVGIEVFGKRALELKCDAPPHDADTVDRVDQSFRVFREDVARLVLDHGITRRPVGPPRPPQHGNQSVSRVHFPTRGHDHYANRRGSPPGKPPGARRRHHASRAYEICETGPRLSRMALRQIQGGAGLTIGWFMVPSASDGSSLSGRHRLSGPAPSPLR